VTPIQLSAERLRAFFPARRRRRKPSSTNARRPSSGEVESLKGLVDEVLAVRTDAVRRAPCRPISRSSITDTFALYNGIFTDVRIEQRFARGSAAGAARS
jgi:hypothetical protein